MGELGEVSFGMYELGELSEVSFRIYKLGELVRRGELWNVGVG